MFASRGDGFPGGAGDLGGCGADVGVTSAELAPAVVSPAPEGIVGFCCARVPIVGRDVGPSTGYFLSWR